MKLLVDNQLPIALSAHLDLEIWNWAISENAAVISKDEDFVFLANRPGDSGRLIWVRLGNCRNHVLLATFDKLLSSIIAAIDAGQRIVEIR